MTEFDSGPGSGSGSGPDSGSGPGPDSGSGPGPGPGLALMFEGAVAEFAEVPVE